MFVALYLMSSNCPSGGTKEIICSLSYLLYLTHGWKLQSSMTLGSWNVRVRSGTPERWEEHWMEPFMSEEITAPAEDIIQSTSYDDNGR